MGLDEPLGKMLHPRAGIVLIGMHRFIFAHDRCCRGLSGAEQGWPARLANGQIYQLHALCLSLSTFRPDNLEHILAILAQSRSAHGFSLLTALLHPHPNPPPSRGRAACMSISRELI